MDRARRLCAFSYPLNCRQQFRSLANIRWWPSTSRVCSIIPHAGSRVGSQEKKKWYKRVKESAVNVKLLPFEVLLGAAAWLLAAAGFVTLSSIFLFRASYSHQGQKGLEQVRSRHVLCMWHSIEILYSAAAEYLLVHRNGAARVFFYLFSLSRFLCISRRVLNLKNTKFDASCIHIVWSYSLSVVWTQFHDLKGKIQKLREKWWNIHLLRGSHTTLKCHDESAIYYPIYPSLAVIMNRETQRRERERVVVVLSTPFLLLSEQKEIASREFHDEI